MSNVSDAMFRKNSEGKFQNIWSLQQFHVYFRFFEIQKDKWISWDENGGLERFNRYVNMTNYNELILNENRNLSTTSNSIKERKF